MENQPLSLSSKEQSAPVFGFPVRVYWEDTDAGGIVFYANYLKFFERARTEWLRSLGLGQQALKQERGGMFVVTEASLRCLRPARLDDLLCITARLQRAGRARCELHQQAWLLPAGTSSQELTSVWHGQAGASLLCEGQVHIAWVDATHLKPQRLPPDLLGALQTPD